MTGVLSALSRGCRAWHFPHCRHTTTGFVNHTPTILYPGINLYLRKFWLEISKLSQVQICSQVQDCWRMVHKTSCIMHYNGEMLSKTAPAECRQHTNYAMSVLQCVLQWVLQCWQHTNHVMSASIAHAFVFLQREQRIELSGGYGQ